MARRGLRKQQGRKSLRPRAPQSIRPSFRPSAPPAASVPDADDREDTHGTCSPDAPRAGSPLPRLVSLSELSSTPPPRPAEPVDARRSAPPTWEPGAPHAPQSEHAPGSQAAHPHRRDEELDDLSEAFFSDRPSAHTHETWDDDHPAPVMPKSSRRAMIVTLSIFGVSLATILLYTAYHNLVMPAPVELSGAIGAELPVPIAAPTSPTVPHGAANTMLQPVPATVEPPPIPPPPAPRIDTAPPGASAAFSPPAPTQALDPAPKPVANIQPPSAGPLRSAPLPARAGDTALARPVKAEPAHRELAPAYSDLLSAGQSLSRRGQHKSALEAYHRALSMQPSGAVALSRIAYLHLNAGDNRLAKEYAARSVEADPKNSEGWIVLGAALDGLGDHPAALVAYRKCGTLATGAYARECQRLAR